jgi:hypothetical protein
MRELYRAGELGSRSNFRHFISLVLSCARDNCFRVNGKMARPDADIAADWSIDFESTNECENVASNAAIQFAIASPNRG